MFSIQAAETQKLATGKKTISLTTMWVYRADSKFASVFAPLYKFMTSSIKHEVPNILYCYQRRTEPGPQVRCTECFVKSRRVVSEWTDRPTNSTFIAMLCTHPRVKVKNS